jgi:hypothetical protein
MMTIEQTVDIPADKRLRLDVTLPETMTASQADVVLIIVPRSASITAQPEDIRAQLTPLRTIEECIAEAKKKAEWERVSGHKPFEALRNRKGPPLFGGEDGLVIQRRMRDEWPD